MPRRRNPENQGLPPRWAYYHRAFYFRVPPGEETKWDGKKRFLLGKTLATAHRTWASRLERSEGALVLIGQALDRYASEVVPTKAPGTQEDNLRAIVRLKRVFGRLPLLHFRAHHAYKYRDERRDAGGRHAPTAANRELEVLSHLFTKCFEWGVPLQTHPMIEGKFRKLHTPPRDRVVEDWEIAEALSLAPRRKKGSIRMMRAYIKVKLLTGRRRIELLRLKVVDCKDDGPIFQLAKQRQTGLKELPMDWSDALRAAVKEALDARPVDISPYVFCNARGEPYLKDDGTVADAWDSLWQRFMDRVLAETAVKVRFTEHDLRRKVGNDAESLARAQELLQHTDSATTKRVYRPRARVKPAR